MIRQEATWRNGCLMRNEIEVLCIRVGMLRVTIERTCKIV